ncbi:MAG: M20/M25/M40 family metallo-hydrolase [Olsenella sp.]
MRGVRPPLETHPDSPLLAALSQTIETATGAAPQMGIFTGYTDSAVVAGLCHNKNCMSYGPGSLELAHKPNEYVPTEDLARVRAVLSELLKASSMRSGC